MTLGHHVQSHTHDTWSMISCTYYPSMLQLLLEARHCKFTKHPSLSYWLDMSSVSTSLVFIAVGCQRLRWTDIIFKLDASVKIIFSTSLSFTGFFIFLMIGLKLLLNFLINEWTFALGVSIYWYIYAFYFSSPIMKNQCYLPAYPGFLWGQT